MEYLQDVIQYKTSNKISLGFKCTVFTFYFEI